MVTDTDGVLTGYDNTVPATTPITITVVDTEFKTDQNYGYVVTGTPGSIQGTVFDDTDFDGSLNGSETGISGGITVYLKQQEG